MLKKLKEMLKSLASMEGALDDAFYALPEYNANTDSRDYIDSARNELYVLKKDLEDVAREVELNDNTLSILLEMRKSRSSSRCKWSWD